MPLSPGTSLGPYQIDAPLGAGGMGEVYKATDTRLDRTVAIKVLPEHVAQDPDLKQRFEREAKTISSLNHPHICTLHDIGNQDGIDFLVMEYLDGETLQQRLEKGALPLDQALTVATQIADALDKAHRQGIVHRDLKPGNIMLTKAGAKLLDFGLAKLQPVQQAGGLSALPTQPADLTQEGAILGTFQYMAREQLEGQEADTRTDIFSFGAVVYEMVTGKKAFEGKSQANLISSIMTADPVPISSLQSVSPPALDSIVETCLAKDPETRWQSVGDVGRQLEKILSGSSSEVGVVPPLTSQPVVWQRVIPLAIGVVVGAVIAGLAVWNLSTQTSTSTENMLRFSLSDVEVAGAGDFRDVIISRDGSQIVYRGKRAEGLGTQLFLRQLDQTRSQPLRGTENAIGPFFSPDGEWVGFQESAGLLARVSVFGGEPQRIATMPDAIRGASWGDDDQIIAGAISSGLSQVSADGGEPVPLTSLDLTSGETSHRFPSVIPGQQAVLFSIAKGPGLSNFEFAVASLESGAVTPLGLAGIGLRYVATGHLVYLADDRSLRAVLFDVDTLAVEGRPVALLEGVVADDAAVQASLSDTGRLVYMSGEARRPEALVVVNRQGETVTTILNGSIRFPRLSPDDDRVALLLDGDTWIRDIKRATNTFLGEGLAGVWKPDASSITFTDRANLYSVPVDRGGPSETLVDSEHAVLPGAWSEDGLWFVYYEIHPETQDDLWVTPDGGEPRPLLVTEYNEANPRISPDGQWVAYASDHSGEGRIYIRPFPEGDTAIAVSIGPGTQPVWSRDGRELFYRTGTQMLSVAVHSNEDAPVGEPVELFKSPLFDPSNNGIPQYDVSLDGQQFLMVVEAETEAELRGIANWFEELKARVPPP